MSPKHFFVLLPFVLVACAASSEEETGESNDELATKGQICAGGIAPATCGAGLKCSMSGRIGKCVDDPNAVTNGASEGDTCGGAAAVRCKTGLTCTKKTASSTTGKCTSSQVTCLAAPTCDSGHHEVSSESACDTDADSECYKRTTCGKTIWCTGPEDEGAGAGQRCGVGFASTIKCKQGLTCSASIGMGTCH